MGAIEISCSTSLLADFIFDVEKPGLLWLYCVLLALASQRKEDINRLFFVYQKSFLVSFFSFLLIPYVGCWSPSPSEMYGLSKECLNGEHHQNEF